MSSIRLSGTSSGYYDLTVPAAAGTNSIDLSALPVKDSNGNLGIGTLSPSASHRLTLDKTSNYGGISFNQNGNQVGQIIQEGATGNVYIDADSNSIGGGLIFRTTGGTTRMTVDGSGRVAMPAQPSFFFRNVNTSTNNNTVILFDQQYHNNGSHYSTSTGRFTAPIAGYYFFYAMVCWDRTAATPDHYCDIRHNGNTAVRMYTDKSGSANVHPQTAGCYSNYMAANDYIDVFAVSGGPIINNGNHCNFGGYKYA